ncbi:MAG: ABC transporter ATP-binding protein [Clostridia bacterium]|nr:ABC transporter ATP-binding protein [Clostridia bacterium]
MSSGERIDPKRRKEILLRIAKYIFRYKWVFFSVVLLTLLSDGVSIVGPALAGKAIDAMGIVKGQVDFKAVYHYAGLMVAFYVAYSVLKYVSKVIMIALSRNIVFNLRQDIFNRLCELPVSFFDRHPTGDIISRITYDTDTINQSLSQDLVSVLAMLTTIVGSFVMMLRISPRMVLIFVFTVPLSMLLSRFITHRTQPLFRKRSALLGTLNAYIDEMVTGQKTIKAYAKEKDVVREFESENDKVVEAYYKADYYGMMMGPCVGFVNNLSLTLVSLMGAFMYMSGGISIGDISSFVLYSRKFSGPINEIANLYGELMSALAAAERVFGLMDEIPEKPDAADAGVLSDVSGDVEVRHVDFGYLPGKTILKDFSLDAPRGSLIAIVGPTGAGKTTLINMLMRFYDIDRGEITVDGKDIYKLTRESVRGAYSMVLQDTWLFYGTIAENIAYAKPDATREEIERAARAAKIDDYIRSLPEGYDTVITDDAANISKGQKQLLTIARAMLLDANMLILDEATSNVDTRTEVKIQQAMRELMKNKTCFVVAHRLSTISHADKILVIDDGKVVESGTHRELMEKRGFYRRLYDAQFE